MSRVVLLLLGLIVKLVSHFVCFLTQESSHCRFFPLPCFFPNQFCLRFCVILLIVAGQHEQVWHCYCSFLGREKKSASFVKARGGPQPFHPKALQQQLADLTNPNQRKGFVESETGSVRNQLGGEKFKPGLLMLPVKLLPPPSLPPTPSSSALPDLLRSESNGLERHVSWPFSRHLRVSHLFQHMPCFVCLFRMQPWEMCICSLSPSQAVGGVCETDRRGEKQTFFVPCRVCWMRVSFVR